MDFAKLIEQRDKFIADATAALERRCIDPAAIKDPVDVQQEQASRVRQRIESLESRKAEIIASADTEIAALKGDLQAREQKIEADRKQQNIAAAAPSVDKASDAKATDCAPSPPAKKTGAASTSKSK